MTRVSIAYACMAALIAVIALAEFRGSPRQYIQSDLYRVEQGNTSNPGGPITLVRWRDGKLIGFPQRHRHTATKFVPTVALGTFAYCGPVFRRGLISGSLIEHTIDCRFLLDHETRPRGRVSR